MRINREKYLLHIDDKEKLIDMRRIIDKIEMVMNNHVYESTDFLDPYVRSLARSILNRFNEIDYIENGGIEHSERKIITIFPQYLDSSTVEEDSCPKNHWRFGRIISQGLFRRNSFIRYK